MGYRDHAEIAQKVRKRLLKTPPNPFSKYTRYISRAERVFLPPDLERPRSRIRLALVSLPAIEDSDIQRKPYNITTASGEVGNDGKRQLVTYPPRIAKTLSDHYQTALTRAVDHWEANIVCVNELGLPSTLRLTPKKDALRHARTLASSNDCVIIAGTSHNRRTFYNTTRIFFRDAPAGGVLYHKQVSATATSVGEYVSVPPDRRTLLLRAFGVNIAVLTCLDMLDFASTAAVVKMSERVDVLLVPCYSDKMEALEDAARFVSSAMSGKVILVNARPSDNREPCRVATFGELGRFADSEVVKGETLINIYDIYHDEFRELKDDLKRQPKDRVEWLFGARDLEAR